MLAHRHFAKFAAVLTAAAVCLSLLAAAAGDFLVEALGGKGVTMEYESVLFDTDTVLDINIRMDADAFQNMLDNAISEEYVSCDVEIGGKTFTDVGIRPKGNTSLSSIVNDPDSDRYSFKLEFDKYIEGQTCFGLDKLVLNNNYADATNMKEAIVYDMYRFLGADASLYNYARLSVNGEYFGVYLALEAVEESFMLRNYGAANGALYKPEGMNLGGGGKGGKGGDGGDGGDGGGRGAAPDFGNMPDMGQMPAFGGGEEDAAPAIGDTPPALPTDSGDTENGRPDFDNFGGFGSMGGSGGADLNYTDDDLDSYETIWEGEVTDTGKQDHKRVVAALKAVSEGKDLETYLDVDNILRYMAVHTFVVNADSLSGNMAHNYYLYESGGRLNILPWDYNLSFGGMNGGDASSVVNDAIDTPFSGTQFFDALLENEEYRKQYHAYLSTLVEEYVFGGGFDAAYTRIRAQIDTLVETDPNALYTYAAYTAAAEILYETVRLRAESVRGQLDGSIPSTDAGQRTDSSALVDASSIDLSVMGTMTGGGRGGDKPAFGGGNRGGSTNGDSDSSGADSTETPPARPDGDTADDAADADTDAAGQNRPSGGKRPPGAPTAPGGDAQSTSTASATMQNLLWYGGMLLLALVGLGAAVLYKRK